MTEMADRGALAAPVVKVEDQATDEERRGGYAPGERSTLMNLVSEFHGFMGEVRDFMGTSLSNDERLGREMGKMKSHMTEHSLRLANVEGITPNGLIGKRVLVADDSPGLLRVAVHLLEKLGCNIDGVASRQQAERMIARNKYDAVLIDLHLPSSTDGVELCRWVQRLWPATAIVVMSGLLDHPSLDSLRAARIEKPFSFEELRDVMYAAMGHGPVLAETQYPPAPEYSDAEEPTLESTLPATRPDRPRPGDIR